MLTGTNSEDLPLPMANVTYTLKLQTDVAWPSGSTLTVAVNGTSTTNALQCRRDNDTTAFTGDLSVEANITDIVVNGTSVALAANGTVTCTFTVTVGTAEQAAGQIGAFTVNSSYFDNTTSITIPDLTVPAFAVSTGCALSVATALANTDTNYISGMYRHLASAIQARTHTQH